MRIYFDTEFTGLHKNTTLISIGLVSEDGKKFYAEFTDYDKSQVNDWIKDNVIAYTSYLKESGNMEVCSTSYDNYYSCGKKDYIKNDLHEWLSQFENVQLYSDCNHYDMVLFIDIFGTAFDLPENVSPVCHDINQDIAKHYGISDSKAFDKSREEIMSDLCEGVIEGDKHNSLYDAEVIKSIYEQIGSD